MSNLSIKFKIIFNLVARVKSEQQQKNLYLFLFSGSCQVTEKDIKIIAVFSNFMLYSIKSIQNIRFRLLKPLF